MSNIKNILEALVLGTVGSVIAAGLVHVIKTPVLLKKFGSSIMATIIVILPALIIQTIIGKKPRYEKAVLVIDNYELNGLNGILPPIDKIKQIHAIQCSKEHPIIITGYSDKKELIQNVKYRYKSINGSYIDRRDISHYIEFHPGQPYHSEIDVAVLRGLWVRHEFPSGYEPIVRAITNSDSRKVEIEYHVKK